MKRRWMVSLMAVAVAISMVACGKSSRGGTENADSSASVGTTAAEAGASGGTRTTNAGEPVDGGILTTPLSSSPKNLNPAKYTSTYESQIIGSICDTLVEYDSGLTEIMSSITASWEVSNDGGEYTFKLRDGMYFQPGQYQDGGQVTTEDIKYSLERSHEPSAMNRLDMLDHCEMTGDTEVKCVLGNPNMVFLATLIDAGNVIVPKEKVEGWGDDLGAHLIGSGPSALEEFRLDQQATLVRNERYWAQKPHLDGVAFRPASDGNQAANILRTEEVNVVTSLTGEVVQVVRGDDTVRLLEMPGFHVSCLYLSMANGPTKGPKVREALTKAVNVEELTGDVYQYGEAVSASFPLSPGSWRYDEAVKAEVPTYSPEVAEALPAEAGYPDGLNLSLYISNTLTRVKVAALFQVYLQQNLNVGIDINTSGWGTFSGIGASGRADVFGMSQTWYPDPYFSLNKLFYGREVGSLGNGQGYNNPEVDKYLKNALLTTDQNERVDLYKKALALITKDTPGIFYANKNMEWGVAPNVQGLVQRADDKVKICIADINAWLSK